MKRVLSILLLVALMATIGGSALAEPLAPLSPPPAPTEPGGMVDETPTRWFVELSSPPSVEGTAEGVLKREKDAFRAAAKKAGLKFEERYAYDRLWNGLSISIARRDLAKLQRIEGVKSLYPVLEVPRPVAEPVADPQLFTALAMTGADIAQTELGFTGKGIKVAVMDTGIDYDHPDLGGCFGPNCRVATGWDFVGDAFNADPTSAGYNPNPTPDPDPDDCNGHGTHVAGIIGANGSVKGVAPDVTFGAYRVFGCEGSTLSDIMLAAMERALADGMQVLNMSIGSAFQWPQYPTAAASDRLVNAGMVVVASIGNNGANGLYSAGAPGVGQKVIGVASYDNSHNYLPYFTVNEHKIGYIPMTFSPAVPTTGTEEIVYIGRGCSAGSAADVTADDPLLADPAGKVALVERGTCSFRVKATRAAEAGAKAVVIHNNAAGVFGGTLGGPGINIPVVGISKEDGLFIRSQSAPVMMSWTDQLDLFLSPVGGLISSFSSYGLAPDLSLKPDIGAPGGYIWSTYPLEKGGYVSMSGTSMSSPHVAGAVALLLQARPNTPAQLVRTILQNSADPKPWWGNPGLGFLDNVHRQGAGMLDIDDAILATARIEPGKLALGESQAGPQTRTLTIRNSGPAAVTYDLSHAPALSTGPNTFTPSFYTGFASVSFSAPSVTVPAGGSATVDVTITANPGLADNSLYGGYIVFTPQGGGQVYRVPYAGFKGDYQSIQALAPTPNGFPWLARLVEGSYAQQGDGAVFTLQGNDVPYILVHLDHQVRLLRVEVFDAKGKAWHRALNEEYVGRNSAATSFFALPFDGTTVQGKKVYEVPNGQYVLKLSVLKALGDANNPADWETWTSPMFEIARP